MITNNIAYSGIIKEIQSADVGKHTPILPDTYLIKGSKVDNRTTNTYALMHLNRKDLLLIDTVQPEVNDQLKKYIHDGFTIKGLILTHGDLLDKAYADLHTVSNDLGDAPIFMHPLDSKNQRNAIQDITAPNDVFEHFSMSTYDFDGHSGGNIAVYSEINNGMLFTGMTALGSSYESKEQSFKRPIIKDDTMDLGLAENWKRFTKPFQHILPFSGKPRLYLTEGQQKDIIIDLGKQN